jgi:hypothetical protein
MENQDTNQNYKNLRIAEDMWLSTVKIDEESEDNGAN